MVVAAVAVHHIRTIVGQYNVTKTAAMLVRGHMSTTVLAATGEVPAQGAPREVPVRQAIPLTRRMSTGLMPPVGD